MGKKEYKELEPKASFVSEPSIPYGDINTLKVQLVNRIMRMEEPQEVKTVLEFLNSQVRDQEQFEKDWERSLTIEDFRTLCTEKLKKIYACD